MRRALRWLAARYGYTLGAVAAQPATGEEVERATALHVERIAPARLAREHALARAQDVLVVGHEALAQPGIGAERQGVGAARAEGAAARPVVDARRDAVDGEEDELARAGGEDDGR